MKSFLGRKTLRDFVTSRSTPENWPKTFSTLKGDNNRRNLGTRESDRTVKWGGGKWGLNIILSFSL